MTNKQLLIATLLIGLIAVLFTYKNIINKATTSSIAFLSTYKAVSFFSKMPEHTNRTNLVPTNTDSASTGSAVLSDLFVDNQPKTPVYFFSHGGPTFMYPKADFGGEPGAYRVVSNVGKFIKNKMKPKFIVVISAHWQSNSGNLIEVAVPRGSSNTNRGSSDLFGSRSRHSNKSSAKTLDPDENELIYDFYGFPDHMYKEEFHSRSNLGLAKDIVAEINKSESQLEAALSVRGIDHGTWVPFKVAFSTNKAPDELWDLEVPLVQVSLSSSDDFNRHYELGKILSKYRNLGGLIVTSGMSVHNLRDLGLSMSQGGRPLPYVKKFNDIIREILTNDTNNGKKLEKLNELQENSSLRKILFSAHPTLEHFMPLVVALGASEGIEAKDQYLAQELYSSETLSLGWGIYQFGKYEN